MAEKSQHLLVRETTLRRIIREEVHTGFKLAGIDPNDVTENQKDMAWLRAWRKTVSSGGVRAFGACLTVMGLGLFGALLVGLGVPDRVIHLFQMKP